MVIYGFGRDIMIREQRIWDIVNCSSDGISGHASFRYSVGMEQTAEENFGILKIQKYLFMMLLYK